MASNRNSFQSRTNNEKSDYKPGKWQASISTPLCAFCNKTVYPAEEIMGAGQKFHKFCFKCSICHVLLNSRSLNERNQKLYCTGCYSREFGPRMVSRHFATSFPSDLDTPPSSPRLNREESDFNNEYYQRQTVIYSSPPYESYDDDDDDDLHHRNLKSTMMSGITTPNTNRSTSKNVINDNAFKMMSISGNICPRCSKTVYQAEEIKAIGKSFHKQCYTCAHCKGTISGAHYSQHDGEIYDNKCYQRLFSPKVVLTI